MYVLNKLYKDVAGLMLKVKTKKAKKKNGLDKPQRNAQGQLLKGNTANPNGRPPNGSTRLDELLKAISRVEISKNKKWLDDLVERSYSSDALAIAILNRLTPILKSVEVSGVLATGITAARAKEIQEKMKERLNHK